ncbi:MAG: glycosyltransferase family 39 protein [Acidobacteria bacterium]|nr:glycosyltransferase family 39 protein [Acidobacteriota bacterium]
MIAAGKLVFLLTFFALVVQGLIFFYDDPDELTALPLVLILGGIAGYLLRERANDPDTHFQAGIFFWAFSIRLWMGMIMYGWDLKELFGDEDASGYVASWGMASAWYENGFDAFASDLVRVFFERQNEGQALIWAIPSFIAGGESRMIVSTVNSFAGALLVIVVFRMTRRVFDSATARIAAVLVTFWMSHILLSATTAKEILVILGEWFVLYMLIRNAKGFSPKDAIATVPALLAVFIMRFYAVYLLAAAALFRFLVASRQNIVRNAIFGTVIVSALMIFLAAGGAIQRDFERIERLNERVDSWREGMAVSTGSGVEIYTEGQSTTLAIPVATVYFFFAPFPWEAFSGSARNAFGAAENIFIIVIIIIGFPALRIFFKVKFVEMAPIFAFCVLYAGMHIWGLSNVGLAWRHKQTIMPLFFMLVAVGITQRQVGWAALTGRTRRRTKDLSIVRAN